MKNLFKSLSFVLVLACIFSPVSEARTIAEHIKLAKGGQFSPTFAANPVATLVSSNGQVITGIIITTAQANGMFTLLYDTNLLDDEAPAACMFDVYTPAATTQFYDFTGLGTGLAGSTSGQSPAAGASYLNGLSSASQTSSENGISLVCFRNDGGTSGIGSVIIYTDQSAD